ncbi:efflux RND transporter periplasmic adaptor subunit [Massilia sp. PAMC28688]|uniref:efflux RND transporter periplasmic adaptor subunit n=1 Tax=Massilia sp. PAMC28688 TaxID=2861283 RepID=UPI001C62CC6D|nr:efflux RND transporter periplasmic adaptor subunit [Massilia sp. PAMC28688]QYF95190.1 efflux RND transporter periplasmic adaptor subunit [Massilia sp. PAMC28688]
MKKQYVAGIALAALICVPVVMKLTRSEPAKAVEIDKIAYRDIKSSVLASGHLLYQEQVLLSPEVIGKVSAVHVKEGQQVAKGDLLLHLDDQSYRAEVAQQEAAVKQQRIAIEQQQLNLANQENQLKRKTELHRVKMISEAAIDDARFAVEAAKIELRNSRSRLEQVQAILNQSRERLAKTTIRSPISGTITALDIKVGETAVASQVSIAGSSLMTIANTSTMMTEVNVDEADIGKIVVGQDVAIHTAAYPDTPLKGEVLIIPLSAKQNPGSPQGGTSLARTYNVKVKLSDTRQLTLRPGMTCRAEIFTASSGKSLSLPLQAVLSNNDENTELATKKKSTGEKIEVKTEYYVFVNNGGKAEKRVVTIGVSDDSQQEILSGVKAGEAVITGPYKILRHLKPGDPVTNATPAPATVKT